MMMMESHYSRDIHYLLFANSVTAHLPVQCIMQRKLKALLRALSRRIAFSDVIMHHAKFAIARDDEIVCKLNILCDQK